MSSLHLERPTSYRVTTGHAPWAGNPPQPAAARQRLIEAAERCIARDGLAATSVASVATEAGVSRPTVYRYFDDRDALVRQAFHAASERLRDDVAVTLNGLLDPADALIEAAMAALAFLDADPVLSAIWNTAASDGTVVSTFTGEAAIGWASLALAPVVELAGWTGAETYECVETTLRFALALLISPLPERDSTELRAYLERRLLPAVGLVHLAPDTPPTPAPRLPDPERTP